MARTGLYKSEIKQARDALLIKGVNPSVDAVRVQLGNTGSKTTIHKYLKELEEEGGEAGHHKTSISEVLQDMVARLAAQLQDEASERIRQIEALSAARDQQQLETSAAFSAEIEVLKNKLQQTDADWQQEKVAHALTRENLQKESIGRHTAEQQVTDLQRHLLENEAYKLSLEEKHSHAREALEHYRQSVKEQRDQDLRRHEQQVQQMQAEMRQLQQSLAVKQDEITRLNQSGGRLAADLLHAQSTINEQHNLLAQGEKKLGVLQVFEQQCLVLEAQLQHKDKDLEEQKNLADASSAQAGHLQQQLHKLKQDLHISQARLEAQHIVTTELRHFFDSIQKREEKKNQPNIEVKTDLEDSSDHLNGDAKRHAHSETGDNEKQN